MRNHYSSAGVIGPFFFSKLMGKSKLLTVIGIYTYWRTNSFQLCADEAFILLILVFNKTELPRTRQETFWNGYRKHLVIDWFRSGRTGFGHHIPLIKAHWIFFLWGYLNDKVYDPKLTSLENLKIAVHREIRNVTPDICRNVINNLNLWLNKKDVM